MSKVKIRKAVLNDADEIANVLLDFYNIEDHEEAKKIFIDEQKKEFHYLIAVEDDQVLGLVTWITHGLPKHGLFELDRICIMTKARGKGIGKKLVNELIDDANHWYKRRNGKARKLYLLTHEDNKNAHIFYERVGIPKINDYIGIKTNSYIHLLDIKNKYRINKADAKRSI